MIEKESNEGHKCQSSYNWMLYHLRMYYHVVFRMRGKSPLGYHINSRIYRDIALEYYWYWARNMVVQFI